MSHSDTDMVLASLIAFFISVFVCICVFVNIPTQADKEITKCEQNLPRNVQCKITAVPMDTK